MRIDRCFVGVCSLSVADGVMTTQFSEAAFKRTLIQNSRQVVALLTSDKARASAPHHIADFAMLRTAVIEQDLDAGVVRGLREAGVDVVAVETAA